jgi:DNA-binding MarR family transcriptional regulator
MEDNPIYQLFLNEKPVRALITIGNKDNVCASDVSRIIDTTYAHTVKIIDKFSQEELVQKKTKGRKKILELTEKGEKYKEEFDKIYNSIEDESESTGEEKPSLSGKY